MRGIVKVFRRPPANRLGDRNGGLPRLSDGVAHASRCPASPRRTLLAESLGKPSLWVIINAPWYKNAISVPERPKRAFYGRQAGRPLRAGARALLETLLPEIAVELPAPENTLNLGALFASPGAAPDRPIWLEIGFGSGEHLAWQAARQPRAGLIGAEVFTQGLARMLRHIKDAGLQNVRLYRGDARELLATLPPDSLGRVFILFPDPWPKKRHLKRRIVNRETLDWLAGAMRGGAELRLATDHMDYAAWMLERLRAHPDFEWLARGPGDWRGRPDDWPPTRYEAKALAQGRRPVYLRYRRVARKPLRSAHYRR